MVLHGVLHASTCRRNTRRCVTWHYMSMVLHAMYYMPQLHGITCVPYYINLHALYYMMYYMIYVLHRHVLHSHVLQHTDYIQLHGVIHA
jgi:hypothetical protein